MFAYVFWHRRDEPYSVEEYERRLIDFHRALNKRGFVGFRGSLVFRVGPTPWLQAGGYEDWYLVDGLGVLEELNDAIAEPELGTLHRLIASMAVDGKGTIVAPRSQKPGQLTAPTATWLAKPRGMGYQEFYTEIEPLAHSNGSTLWRRQLALGPTPEFLLVGGEPPVPQRFYPIRVERRLITDLSGPIET